MKVTGSLRERIIAQLADPESRKIITSVLGGRKTATSIGKELSLPPSTLYRKISELRESGLLMIDSFALRSDGKREALYARTFSEIVFRTKGREIELEVVLSARSLERRWFELFSSRNASSPEQP
jgi:DNA-binding transcriptional ArsR family regulator